MIVVADTSPISALLTIEKADLLPRLYGEVIIPNAVRNELLRSHPTVPNWVKVADVRDRSEVERFSLEVDAGEAEAIQLAKELAADKLLIDEHKGRNLAQSEGLRIIGVVGVMVVAKNQGLIPSVSEMISLLRSRANVYLSEDIIAAAKQMAGE